MNRQRVSQLLSSKPHVAAAASAASPAAVSPSNGAVSGSTAPAPAEAATKPGASWWSKRAPPPVAAHRPIVGRARELDVCRAAFERMLTGRRQLVLISGEPGIGKTRCAEALADIAEDQGSLVLWGRCHEDAGAPPYWPWVQIIRAYIEASSLDEVRLNMGTAAKDIGALVPELLDSSQQVHETSSAITDSSGRSPLVLFNALLGRADRSGRAILARWQARQVFVRAPGSPRAALRFRRMKAGAAPAPVARPGRGSLPARSAQHR